jgi:hypothetical protein
MNETILVQSEVPAIVSFLPLMIFTLPFIILIAFMAKRKGKNVFLSVLFGIIPFANIIYALWLASQTDIDLLKRIEAIENKKC